jgi:hypothetical protein
MRAQSYSPVTRVNPKYADKIYGLAIAAIIFNAIFVCFNIPPANLLAVSDEIKNVVWLLNNTYELDLTRLGFGAFEINAVAESMALANLVGIAVIFFRAFYELSRSPKTKFDGFAVFFLFLFTPIPLLLVWLLRFTTEVSIFELSVRHPFIKNVLELNLLIFGAYLGAAELLCQIIAFFRRATRPAT